MVCIWLPYKGEAGVRWPWQPAFHSGDLSEQQQSCHTDSSGNSVIILKYVSILPKNVPKVSLCGALKKGF